MQASLNVSTIKKRKLTAQGLTISIEENCCDFLINELSKVAKLAHLRLDARCKAFAKSSLFSYQAIGVPNHTEWRNREFFHYH